jgi:glycosyltransferase involved in cell wall biosynthesis
MAEVLKEKEAQYPWLILQNWVAYADLPTLYASAHAFILPSLFEPWGLVINEALAANLPVAASTAVGALPDLLGEPYPLSFNPENVAEIAAVLEKLALEPKRPSEKLNHFSPETWVATLLAGRQ